MMSPWPAGWGWEVSRALHWIRTRKYLINICRAHEELGSVGLSRTGSQAHLAKVSLAESKYTYEIGLAIDTWDGTDEYT